MPSYVARIKAIGVGGGGCNAIESMIGAKIEGVEFLVANTDAQVLERHSAPERIQLGEELTRGLGAGADPDVGRRAALESEEQLRRALGGADLVFVTAGMGGGTGTGAGPVIARIARDLGALTIGVVTRPFRMEGGKRARRALEGIEALRAAADAVLVVPNDRILDSRGDASWRDGFRIADEVLAQAVRGLAGIVHEVGEMNADLADLRKIMGIGGTVVLGLGRGRGPKRALEAAHAAISSPLLDEASIDGALGLLVNITAGPALSLREAEEAADYVERRVDEEAEVIIGSVIDPALGDDVLVTVVATGIGAEKKARRQPLLAPKAAPAAAPVTPAPATRPIFRTPAIPSEGRRRVQERAAAYSSRDERHERPTLPGFDSEE